MSVLSGPKMKKEHFLDKPLRCVPNVVSMGSYNVASFNNLIKIMMLCESLTGIKSMSSMTSHSSGERGILLMFSA